MPQSPGSEAQSGVIPDTSLLSSPRANQPMDGKHLPHTVLLVFNCEGILGISEIDMTSPLNYGTPASRGTTPGGVGVTPIRARTDVRSERRMRTVAVDGAV